MNRRTRSSGRESRKLGFRGMTRAAVRPITAETAFPLRRRHLRPTLPSAASRFAGDDDPAALHLGAFVDLWGDDVLIGVVSFLPRTQQHQVSAEEYQLQGIVTVPSVRNQGVGAQLVADGVAQLRSRGATRIWCDGRSPAISFYERLEFSVVGEEFVAPGTGPHYRFVRDLRNGANDSGGGEPEA